MAPFRVKNPRYGVHAVAVDDKDARFRFYLDRLVKMIPAEVVTLYTAGIGFIPHDQKWWLIVWTLFCLLMVIVVRTYGTRDPNAPDGPQSVQVGVVIASTIAFVIWAYTLGGPFVALGWHVPWIGSLAVLAYTFILPYFYLGPRE